MLKIIPFSVTTIGLTGGSAFAAGSTFQMPAFGLTAYRSCAVATPVSISPNEQQSTSATKTFVLPDTRNVCLDIVSSVVLLRTPECGLSPAMGAHARCNLQRQL